MDDIVIVIEGPHAGTIFTAPNSTYFWRLPLRDRYNYSLLDGSKHFADLSITDVTYRIERVRAAGFEIRVAIHAPLHECADVSAMALRFFYDQAVAHARVRMATESSR